MKKKTSMKDILLMQLVFLIYSCSSVVAKIASANDVVSIKFVMFYGLQVVILGIYALLWQQLIKRVELSVAYANKAVCLLWALIWSVVLFHETLKVNQVVGILIVVAGIAILNSGHSEETSADDGKEAL